jgi:hypothetical protein
VLFSLRFTELRRFALKFQLTVENDRENLGGVLPDQNKPRRAQDGRRNRRTAVAESVCYPNDSAS